MWDGMGLIAFGGGLAGAVADRQNMAHRIFWISLFAVVVFRGTSLFAVVVLSDVGVVDTNKARSSATPFLFDARASFLFVL